MSLQPRRDWPIPDSSFEHAVKKGLALAKYQIISDPLRNKPHGQKTQELTAERHYSLVDNAQSKNRGSKQPRSVEKQCLFQAEVLQDIVESAGEAANHGLKTADEAALD